MDSDEEFEAGRKELMVRDDEGRRWAKSRRTGEWHYHDGDAWVMGTPPGYQPKNHQVAAEQSEPLPTEDRARVCLINR